jgi:hypothetical protein
MNIKTAEEILIESVFLNIGITEETKLWLVNLDISSNIINAMKEYAAQFIDLAVKDSFDAKLPNGNIIKLINKESILKIKEQIK